MDAHASHEKSFLEKARDSIERASSELSLLMSITPGNRQQPGSGATGENAAGYRRLHGCCADAIASMMKCIWSEASDDFVPLYTSGTNDDHTRQHSLRNFLFVVFVAQLILVLYLSFVLLYMPLVGIHWFNPLSLFFHLCMVLCNISYIRGCTTDAGSVPHTEEWLRGSAETHDRKRTGEKRFCNKENVFKPDRAHFCALRNANALRMDHFCPWLNNTIGFFNYKFFFLFIFYAAVLSDTLAGVLLHALLTHKPVVSVFLGEATALSFLLGIVLTPFTLFHMWLTSRNMTTIELCERRDSSTPEHRYDIGVWKNWQQIMGYPLTWFLPLSGPEGDGLHFPLNPRFGDVPQHEPARCCAVALMTSLCEDLAVGCEVIGSSFVSLFKR